MNLKWWVAVTSLLVSIVTMMTTLAALVWGAATISSSVNQLKEAVTTVTGVADGLRRDVADTKADVSAIKAVVNVLQSQQARP